MDVKGRVDPTNVLRQLVKIFSSKVLWFEDDDFL